MTDHLTRARDLVPRFRERAATWDRDRRYCHENVADLAEAGLMGMSIPAAYGGPGLSLKEIVPVVEAIAGACTLTGRIVVEGNMGALSAVMTYGTEAQKALAAELVLAGDKPAICITEPGAGSDATAMTTRATPVPGGWRLDGIKHWITGGGVSKLHLVFAQTKDGIRGFLTLPGEGLKVARLERTMGLCGMPEAELRFENHFVPDEMMIPNASFGALIDAYNTQRVGAGTIALGVAAEAADRARDYLDRREQFDRPLSEFQGLQWMLADMDTELMAARLLLHDAAASADPFPDRTKAARAKLMASETAVRVVDRALQMFGARGYGGEEPLERMYRDVRMFTIGGGTAQVLRNQIAAHVLGRKLPQRRQVVDAPKGADMAAE
ncbi:acyl-CoA dehydrogenase family protein [Jannaschia seohaensis]|uniref:Butyryl-CoA dehydrogenase n=1 Tax=Jannaschia seohaensis TaxID=475081 RepID=A0A2Y9B1K4_9RHOB|nr:acyl-CoA dehydrogenase family protein [Jannaschia seohaensis]PWJ13793.1 butyryl-CoA dehydrogenase [Jannaschia seohaensis]SSA50306.1 butyryl-CoA dehydrogenase [Jannaschia seohaensis]